jgi:hypothetical protein
MRVFVAIYAAELRPTRILRRPGWSRRRGRRAFGPRALVTGNTARTPSQGSVAVRCRPVSRDSYPVITTAVSSFIHHPPARIGPMRRVTTRTLT